MMIGRTVHVGRMYDAAPDRFPPAKPPCDRVAETYYICAMVKAQKRGVSAYVALPLTRAEAGTLKGLNAMAKGGGLAGRVQRQQFFDVRKLETRVFMARSGAYKLNDFVPAAEAEELIRATGVL